jgi:hypothetical protein
MYKKKKRQKVPERNNKDRKRHEAFSGSVVKSESILLRTTIGLGCDVFGHLVQAA